MFLIIYDAKLIPTCYTVFKHILQSCYTNEITDEKNSTFLSKLSYICEKKHQKLAKNQTSNFQCEFL